MSGSRIQKLVKSIRSKQFLTFTYKIQSYQPEQLLTKLKYTEQKHDELLTDCLSLIELLNETINRNYEKYENLTQELEREKIQRKLEMKQLQDNIDISDGKLNELRVLISDREIQNGQLRTLIEEKDAHIEQLQAYAKETFMKLSQNYNKKLEQQLEAERNAITNQMNQANIEKSELKIQVAKLQQENQMFLEENQLLSNRLQELIKHVKELQVEESVKNQITPRIIYNFNQEDISRSASSREEFSEIESPHKKVGKLNKEYQQQSSGSSSSRDRMVLRQILNTQDRKSNNFDCIDYSKERIYLLISNNTNDENNPNILNIGSRTQEKPTQDQVQRPIQQFNTLDQNYSPMNPYFIFFTLISQCAKIKSGDLEAASAVDLSGQWNNFISGKVPLHDWYPLLLEKVQAQVAQLEGKI